MKPTLEEVRIVVIKKKSCREPVPQICISWEETVKIEFPY